MIKRAIQFVFECVVAFLIAGVVMGATVPFLSRRNLVPDWPWNAVMVWGTILVLVAALTLRPGGSLRRRD